MEFSGTTPSSSHQSYPDCIINTRGYDFREGHELTAFDLLRYGHAAGNISRATVLSDLAPKLRGERLAKLAPAFERSCTQRLGYLLDFLKQPNTAAPLYHYLEKDQPLPWIDLEPGRHRAKEKPPIERSERWNVLVRGLPEIDA